MTANLRCERCQTELAPDALFCPMCGAPRLRPDGDSLIGTIIGDRYLLHRRIGHGASGNIYAAEHVTLRRRVCVKVLHHELSRDDLSVERFRREATTVGQIDNEHIVEVYDFGRLPDGRLFLAMEFLEGETLKDALERDGRLPIAKVVDVIAQTGEALMEAHAMGYIHRDLRPRNVFLARRRGQDGYVKLLDFGLSKLVEREGEAASTSLGMTFGDPHYMSPEQAHGDPVDRRGDIYSLGCMAFQMLTGTPPFTGERVFDVLTKHLEEAPRAPSQLRPEVPAWLDAVVMRCLAKRPDERFVTVYRLVEALREGQAHGAIMPDAVARRAATAPPPAPAPRSREQDAVAAPSPSASNTATLPRQTPPLGAPPPAAPPVAPAGAAPPPSSSSSSAGMSGMWFADGEAMEEDARRAEDGKAPARKKNGATRPSWSQEVVYDDAPDRKRMILIAGGVIAAALVVALVIALWPSGKKANVAQAAAPADAAPAAPPPPDAAPRADAAVAVVTPDAGAARPTGVKPVHVDRPVDHDDVPRLVAGGSPDAGPADGAQSADAAQADFYVKLGRQALAKGDPIGAATNFNKAREFDSRNADAIAGLGEVAMQQGYYDDATVHLGAAVRLAPRSARIWTLLGQAYLGAGKHKEAQDAFRRALKLDPGNDPARKGLDEASR
jgi:serine/threonine protein kinase